MQDQVSTEAALVKDTTTTAFRQDVIAESARQPVLVDFWAPWCGPCKQLTPLIEKVVRSYSGKVRLVKVNVDENQAIAAQLRIQSLPTIYAFRDGQPVDGFVGAQPESAIKASANTIRRPTKLMVPGSLPRTPSPPARRGSVGARRWRCGRESGRA